MSKFTMKSKPKSMTDDELHIDFVETNLNNCKQIIFDAETCNKGRNSHDINANLYKIKSVMKRIKKKKPIDIDQEDVWEACKYMQRISSLLWLSNRTITTSEGVKE